MADARVASAWRPVEIVRVDSGAPVDARPVRAAALALAIVEALDDSAAFRLPADDLVGVSVAPPVAASSDRRVAAVPNAPAPAEGKVVAVRVPVVAVVAAFFAERPWVAPVRRPARRKTRPALGAVVVRYGLRQPVW